MSGGHVLSSCLCARVCFGVCALEWTDSAHSRECCPPEHRPMIASHRMLQLRAYQRDVLPQWRELWRELSIPSASVDPTSEPFSHLLSVLFAPVPSRRRPGLANAHMHAGVHIVCTDWYRIIVLILAILSITRTARRSCGLQRTVSQRSV
jgi:hypothetical protein